MARLWIANCTMQDQTVCYRLDFDKNGNYDEQDKFRSYKQEKLPTKMQISIGGDLHKAQMISIIDQLTKNGLTKFDEVSRSKPFTVPYIYREDQRVPDEAVRRQRDINNGVYEKQGAQRRANAAVGVNKAVLDAANLIAPKLTEVEFEQVAQSEMGEKRIEEGYRVDMEGTGGKPGGKPGRKNARASA
jgi:hypothetical protein